MSIIQWGIDFYTGLPEVDRQHQRLVALANRLSELAEDRPEVLDQAFQELRDYVREHFSHEEQLMQDAQVDPDHFAYHKNAHNLFVAKLSALWESRNDGSGGTLEEMLRFLTTWILQHVLQTDQKMAFEIHSKLGTKAPHNMFSHF